MALTDPRAVEGRAYGQVGLAGGLDLTSGKSFAPPGTLADCVNFEVVDGHYERTQGIIPLGGYQRSIPNNYWWFLAPDVNHYLWGGTSDIEGELWYWFANGDESLPIGQGIMAYSNGTDEACFTHIQGSDPGDSIYFVTFERFTTGSGSWLRLPDTQRFKSSDDPTGELLNDGYPSNDFFINNIIATHLYSVSPESYDDYNKQPGGHDAISHVFQHRDDFYCVRDHFGGAFVDGEEEPSYGDVLEVPAGASPNFVATVIDYELTSGSWEGGDAAGWIYMRPDITDDTASGRNRITSSWDASAVITNNTTTNKLGDTNPQTSPASVIRQKNKGLIWKLDGGVYDTDGWYYIDAGYSVAYNQGAVAPITQNSPLVVTDSLGGAVNTGYVALTSPATEYPATGTYSAWAGLANLAADDGSYATSTILATDYSRILELTTTTDLIPGTSKILGVEIAFGALAAAANAVEVEKVMLRNDATGAEMYLSQNRANNTELTTGEVAYLYGAQLDTFGFDEILQDDINANDLTVLIQFYNNDGVSRVVTVDYVNIIIHYIQTEQDVYFYDTLAAADSAEGSLYAYQVFDGDWSTDDASGWLTVHDIDNPSDVKAGHEIRSATGGAGDLIAVVKHLEANTLPGHAEMIAEDSMSQSFVANYYGDDEASSVYVTNGVSPMFAIDSEDRFQFIRTPVDATLDKPRYAAFHDNHVLLSLGDYVMVSSIGAPNNFQTYDGASSWSVGDTVTGLVNTEASTTQIICEDSVSIFQGSAASGEDAFRMKRQTHRSGGKHYTATAMNGASYVDNVGISTIAASDRFGDFQAGRNNKGIRPWTRDRLQFSAIGGPEDRGVKCAIPVRGKNQYRIYFKDGYILCVTFSENPDDPTKHYMFQHYDYDNGTSDLVPTSIDSSVTSWGEERLVMGTLAGDFILLDANSGIWWDSDDDGSAELGTITSFIELNPLHAGDPLGATKFLDYTVIYEDDGFRELYYSDAVDYESPADATEFIETGAAADAFDPDRTTQTVTLYPSEVATVLSIRLENIIRLPGQTTRLLALIPRMSRKGTGKDNLQQSRGE